MALWTLVEKKRQWLQEKNQVTFLLRKALSFFPTAVFLLAVWAFLELLREPGFGALFVLLFLLYGLPVLVFRLVNHFLPLQEGFSYIPKGKVAHPWHNAYKIQSIYVAFPALEMALRLIPGAYAAWLRLWGAKVGRDVYFAPQMTIMDRSHVDLGDGCFLGNRSYLSPHVVRAKNGKTLVYFKAIKIGRGAFIGLDSRLGPGVTVGEGVCVPAATDLSVNQQVLSHLHFQRQEGSRPATVKPEQTVPV